MSTIWPRYRLQRFYWSDQEWPLSFLTESEVAYWTTTEWGKFKWGFGPRLEEVVPRLDYPMMLPHHWRKAYSRGRVIAGTPIDQSGIIAPLLPPDPNSIRADGVYPSVFPRRRTWKYRVHTSFFGPTGFEGLLPPVPLPQARVVPELGSRGRWSHHVQGGAFEPTPYSALFEIQVWTEPGVTPISSTWTEPGVTPISSSWTEPAETPITSSWTEET